MQIGLKGETFITGPNSSGKSFLLRSLLIGSNFLPNVTPNWITSTFGEPAEMVRSSKESVYGEIEVGCVIDGSKYSRQQRVQKFHSFGFNYLANGAGIKPGEFPDQINKLNKSLHDIAFLSSDREFIPLRTNIFGASVLDPVAESFSQYVLHNYTKQRSKLTQVEEWMGKLDPGFKGLNPLAEGGFIEVSGERTIESEPVLIPMVSQGSGTSRALQIISLILFSPNETTIIIEEAELNLHPLAIEVLFDLFNYAVKNLKQQIIITTHSWDFILPALSDLGVTKTSRSGAHEKLDPDQFGLLEVSIDDYGTSTIRNQDFKGKYTDVRNHFKNLIG